jgi:hypothetical protein
MKQRMNYANAAPGAYHAMAGLQKYVNECGLEHKLLELVKLRAPSRSMAAPTAGICNERDAMTSTR